MLKKHEKNFNIELRAITIDEGTGSEKALLSAKKVARQLGVEHHEFSFEAEFGFRMDRLKPFLAAKTREKLEYCQCGEPTSQDAKGIRRLCRACQILEEIGCKH